MAEYKELTQVLYPLKTSSDKGDKTFLLKKIPDKFSLNKGHVCFFYDKGMYLFERYKDLEEELRSRSVDINKNDHKARMRYIVETFAGAGAKINHYLMNNWTPSEEDMNIVRERIRQRIFDKPHLYPDKDIFLNR
jgi:deoxyribonuclease (pyrimidine dimer)